MDTTPRDVPADERRQLKRYPHARERAGYLTLAILAAMVSNYQALIAPGVLPLLERDLGFSLRLFGLAQLVALPLGAVGALVGGLSDRFGRARIVVLGAGMGALVTLATAMSSGPLGIIGGGWAATVLSGATLVATLALARDFSPRLSRAFTVGLWSIGPWGGQVLASLVASFTLPLFGSWQSQYVIAGCLSLLVAGACLLWLRELTPALRRRVFVRAGESALAEAARPERLRLPLVRIAVAALGYSLFQIVRFSTGTYLPAYLSTTFEINLASANRMAGSFGLGVIVGELLGGLLSDRLQLRKPVALCGALGVICALLLFAQAAPGGELRTAVVALAGLSLAMALTNVAWVAGYSETTEELDVARVGTALAGLRALTRLVLLAASLLFIVIVGDGDGWTTWWWLCAGCVALSLPALAALSGPWWRR